MKVPHRSFARVFAVPLALALATLAGLVIGLTGEGARDLLAWLLLAPLPLVFAVAWARRA
jgi:hypothetical protein